MNKVRVLLARASALFGVLSLAFAAFLQNPVHWVSRPLQLLQRPWTANLHLLQSCDSPLPSGLYL